MKFSWIVLGGLIALNAQAGNELGNGGDGFAQEFTALGRRLLESIKAQPDPRIADTEALAAAVEKTRVTTSTKLELRGAEVDAINYPAQAKIEVNRTRWKEYDVRQKASLVLHEYLGIAGIDDQSYQISSAYLELPHLSAPGAAAAPEARPLAGTNRAALSELSEAAPTPNRWSLAVGTALSWFGGNAGELFSMAGTPLELRAGFLLAPRWNLRLSAGRQEYGFTAVETGPATARMDQLSAAAEYHLNEKQWNGQTGFDPYLGASLGHLWRTQVFSALNQISKDTALTAGVAAGVNYFVSRRASLSLEGRMSPLLFKDRYDQSYLESGVVNTTGTLYAANVSLQYVF